MKTLLKEITESLIDIYQIIEEDPLFARVIVSQTINKIDYALFEQEQKSDSENELIKFLNNIIDPNFLSR